MADGDITLDDLFAEDVTGVTGVGAQPTAGAGSALRSEPLSDEERVIVQNLFDTSRARRAAYLDSIGLELSPEDDNKYRPKGSIEGFNAEIDPGISAFFKKGGLKELTRDMSDIAFDSAVTNLIQGFGMVKGAAAGGALGGPIVAVVGSILGGAAGNAAAEVTKKEIGDIYLDKEIPLDKKNLAMQSALVGALPVALKGTGKFVGGLFARSLRKSKEGIINSAKQLGGGNLTAEVIEAAGKDPDKFSPAAVKGANKKLKGLVQDIFGTSPEFPTRPKQIKGDGVFGRAMDPLHKQAKEEIERLATNPQANFNVEALKAPMNNQIDKLSKKFSQSGEERAALKYLREQVKFLDNKKRSEINFKEAREFLGTIQDDVFGENPIAGSSVISQAVGGGDDQLRAMIDLKAANVGSKLPEINARRHQIFNLYKNTRSGEAAISPSNIQTAFIGSDTVKKQVLQDQFDQIDQVLGTSFKENTQTLNFQRAIEQLFESPKAGGSGNILPEITARATSRGLKGAVGGGIAGGVLGGPTGAKFGAIIGGTAGLASGAREAARQGTPQRAIQAFQQLGQAEEQLERRLGRSFDLTRPGSLVEDTPIPRFLGPVVEASQAQPVRGLIDISSQQQEALPPIDTSFEVDGQAIDVFEDDF